MDINQTIFEHKNLIFNTPLEFALRCLCIINEVDGNGIDLDRLVYYDYLILNTGDVTDIESLHPSLPFRGAQVLVKREIIKDALVILISKQLISIRFDTGGIRYYKNELTSPFSAFLETPYVKKLNYRVTWVVNNFKSYPEKELSAYITKSLGKWGGEFIKESIFRNTKLENS